MDEAAHNAKASARERERANAQCRTANMPFLVAPGDPAEVVWAIIWLLQSRNFTFSLNVTKKTQGIQGHRGGGRGRDRGTPPIQAKMSTARV
jgi:hypothetical protein